MFSRHRTDAKVESLRRVEGLSTLSEKELWRLAGLADLLEVPDATYLTREGEAGEDGYLIVAGSVRVLRGGDEIARLGPGDFVGEMALLDREPRTADVVTDGATRVLVFDLRAFERLLDSAPQLTRRLLTQVASRLRATPTHVET